MFHGFSTVSLQYYSRGVVPGGAGVAMAPPDFGRSVNPISTRGTDYAHLISTGTPGFSDLPTALWSKLKKSANFDSNDQIFAIIRVFIKSKIKL